MRCRSISGPFFQPACVASYCRGQTVLHCAHRTSTFYRARSASKEGICPLLPLPLLSCSLSHQEGGLGWSPTARVERPQFHRGRSVSTAIMLLPSLLAIPGVSAAWLILDCARPTSTFRACALREQEDDQAALPKSFAPRPSSKSPPIPTEPPLPGSPIFSLLNSPVGMPEVGACDPPEE